MTEVSEGDLPGAAPPQPPERVDGRRQRSIRTRQAIIAAYLSLIEKSQRIPTAEQVAREANLSERAIFAHFADRIALGSNFPHSFIETQGLIKQCQEFGLIAPSHQLTNDFWLATKVSNINHGD